jgi:hypothetical protein
VREREAADGRREAADGRRDTDECRENARYSIRPNFVSRIVIA